MYKHYKSSLMGMETTPHATYSSSANLKNVFYKETMIFEKV